MSKNIITLTSDSGNLLVNYKNFLPCGAIVNFAGDTAPSGWLICDGRSISKDTYSSLFDIIGTKYGNDTSLNFILPDLQDRVPVGKKSSTTLGAIGGNTDISLNLSQLPSHTHSGSSDSNGAHTHTGTTALNGSHSHTNNSSTSLGLITANGANTANSVDDSTTEPNLYTTPQPLTIYEAGSHTHGFTTDSNGSHSHTITIGNTGSGASIDIRNKFIVLNYIIKY